MEIEIKLKTGNEAFQSSYDIARVLEKLAGKIQSVGIDNVRESVFDENGNSVGTIKVN
tara:strand:+ start:142 stop:315 length:174 start_codon:yes stop_codon:yes gene_type:complete